MIGVQRRIPFHAPSQRYKALLTGVVNPDLCGFASLRFRAVSASRGRDIFDSVSVDDQLEVLALLFHDMCLRKLCHAHMFFDAVF